MVINLMLLVVTAVIAVLIWPAPLAIGLLAGGFQESICGEATQMVRRLPALAV